MVSAADLALLPDITGLRRLSRALAMLDAILSPDWDLRYYSFDSRWAPGELMASMRNGSGDHWFALFCSSGVAMHGFSHEAATYSPGSPQPEIFRDLPPEFHANFLREPAFDTANSTFCVWRRMDDLRWFSAATAGVQDGSSELLALLQGDPHQYVAFATEYYERELPLEAIVAVYNHSPLSAELLRQLNPDVSMASLTDDVEQIGYPEI